MIHHIIQTINNENTQYLMLHATHFVKKMCAIQPLIFMLPLNIGA
jgi:hypothetical protein